MTPATAGLVSEGSSWKYNGSATTCRLWCLAKVWLSSLTVVVSCWFTDNTGSADAFSSSETRPDSARNQPASQWWSAASHGEVHRRSLRGVEPVRRTGQEAGEHGWRLVSGAVRQLQGLGTPAAHTLQSLLVGRHVEGDGCSVARRDFRNINAAEHIRVGMAVSLPPISAYQCSETNVNREFVLRISDPAGAVSDEALVIATVIWNPEEAVTMGVLCSMAMV